MMEKHATQKQPFAWPIFYLFINMVKIPTQEDKEKGRGSFILGHMLLTEVGLESPSDTQEKD
jgi:hypothetical protein